MSRAGIIAVAAGVAGGLAVAIVTAWFFLLRDIAEPVSVGEVITTFREEETAPAGPSPVTEGVYVYATNGSEKTDALTGVTHRYPLRSTITVRGHECGLRMRWDVLKGRSTEWVYCVTPTGWELRSQDERHTFFGRTERTTYTCEDTPIRPAPARVGLRWPVSCSTDAARETGTARVVGRERFSLTGGPVATLLHIRKTTTFTGEIRGTARHDIWFHLESGLPDRIAMVSRTTNDSPVGDVHYEEDVTLRLTSLTPRR